MNENDTSTDKAKLKDLVNQYQEQRAPIGFAERVAARTKDAKKSKAYSLMRFPMPFGIGATIGVALVLVVSSTIVVVKLTNEAPVDIQLAQQESNTYPQVNSESKNGIAEQDETTEKIAERSNMPSAEQPETDVAKLTTELASLPSPQEAGFANVAVLTELSTWLSGGNDELNDGFYTADFYDMPDLADLDDISDMS